MPSLFGCLDPALGEDALRELLDAAGARVLDTGPWLAGIDNGAAAAAWGGNARREADGLLAALIGEPRWTTPDLAALARNEGHSRALAEAWREDGPKLCRRLAGPFSVAVIDSHRRQVFLALDRVGQRHLYYSLTPAGAIVFGSSAPAVLAHVGVDRAINPQAIFDYLYCHHCPSPRAIYRGLHKLEGAQALWFRDGEIDLEYYWEPDFQERPVERGALAAELRQTIQAAVAGCADGTGAVGAFLSGGLDSSTVAGALAAVRPGAAPSFSIGFDVEGYDELDYARIAAKHFQTRPHELRLTADEAVNAIPAIAAAFDEPYGNSSALPAYFCAQLARSEGIELLLAGDGGDELFAGNQRYVRQLLFERYLELPSWLRRVLEGGLERLPPGLTERMPLRKAVRFIVQARTPLPDRLHDYNFLHRAKLTEVFAPDFIDLVDGDAPLAGERDTFFRMPGITVLNRMLHLDWETTLHDNDLVKVNRMCDLAGLRVAYPMLDDAVVALSCRIPSRLKLNGGKLRAFYKEAMQGFLPPAILAKRKHGFGLPFGIWLKEHRPLQELAYDSIGRLKQRPWFAPRFLDTAIDWHRHGHAAYYGELIWVLMMLELWLEANEGRDLGTA